MAIFLPDHTIESLTGGVNTRDQPVGLGPSDLVSSVNMMPVGSTSLVGRGGQTNLFANPIDSNPIRSLYRFYKQSGARIAIATSGAKVYAVDPSGATEIASGFTPDKKFSIVNWSTKDKIYLTNGVEPIQSYDGSTFAALGGSPPICSQIEFHDDRLWALQGNLLYFTDLNVDNVWPAASALSLADKFGGSGQFVKSFGRGLLVVAKDSGLYRFEGSPLLGGKLTRYSDVKCIAPWSAAIVTSQKNTPDSILLLAQDGIYATDGFNCAPISGKIDPLFSGFFRTAVGRYYPKKRQYLLSFNPVGSANDQMWVGTYVDGPNGAFVSWSPYSGFNADSFSVWDGSGDNGELYYGRSDDGMIRRADIGNQDIGVDYKCCFQTRWENFGTMTRSKQVRWMFPVFEATRQTNYRIGHTFGERTATGHLDSQAQMGIAWGPGVVTWGPGSVTWVGGSGIQSRVTSTLNFNYGRYVSFYFENTGDGPGFKFHSLAVQTKMKEARVREMFALPVS